MRWLTILQLVTQYDVIIHVLEEGSLSSLHSSGFHFSLGDNLSRLNVSKWVSKQILMDSFRSNLLSSFWAKFLSIRPKACISLSNFRADAGLCRFTGHVLSCSSSQSEGIQPEAEAAPGDKLTSSHLLCNYWQPTIRKKENISNFKFAITLVGFPI